MEQSITVFNTIKEIEASLWDSHVHKRYFLTHHYLEAIEMSSSEMKFRYALVTKGETLLAVFYFQILPFQGSDLDNYLPNNFLRIPLQTIMHRFKTDLLVLGNVIFTCEHGVLITDDYPGSQEDLTIEVIKTVNDTLRNKTRGIMISEALTEKACEFYRSQGFHPFRVEDRMELDISPFSSFDDYKSLLTSKYRVRLNKIYKLNTETKRIKIDTSNYDEYHEDILRLFNNVLENSTFNIGRLDANYFINLLKSQKRFCIDGYIHNGKLVAFISYFLLKNILEVHYIGIDYNYNESNKVYNFVLYNMIEIGIDHKTGKICYSRTSQELKSTLGAYPVPVYSYLKVNNSFLNRFTAYFLSKITPKAWIQRYPFKKDKS